MALTILPAQMGHDPDVSVVGAGTVKIGRSVVDEIGGDGFTLSGADFEDADFSASLMVFLGAAPRRPAIIGGGSSRPSAAFRDSCLAKSDACHHSRNFRAKMDVGSKNCNDPSSLGPTTCVNVRLLNMLLDCPGRAAAIAFGAVAAAMAR